MKEKLLALLCILMLLSPICYAEVDFNVDDYSSAELAEIYSIVSEKINGFILVPEGYYVVGQDLPAGKYTILQCSEVSPDDFQNSWTAIFANVDDYKAEGSHWSWTDEDTRALEMCNTLWNGMTCELSEGMVLAVAVGPTGIRKVEASIFSSLWE